MTKEIQLTQGKVALVDDDDFDRLARYKWYALRHRKTLYAMRNEHPKLISMHRIILGSIPGVEVDHINGDGLDNRRCNLRVATHAENNRNHGKRQDNSSGYKGVSWDKTSHKWKTEIMFGGKRIYLGSFIVKEDAARAYNEAAKRLHGAFARLNEI